eukprot:TRINITY_DN6747_c0_g1_i1.p1 TRINITY_DN6747_c0_g1~~TRINITY_DN6747_c0_g1_i1.p1  ORF type:complete len:431 (-),score=44.33 TRINITY_DN6747_c0_g1_i1:67-1359(-)
MAPSILASSTECIQDRLYWLSTSASGFPLDTPEMHCFSIDDVLVYEPYVFDFGPLDLGMTYRYITMLESKMADPKLFGKAIVHCCCKNADKRSNAAYLICAYMVIVHRTPAETAFEPFKKEKQPFAAFRDVSRGPSMFPLTILDCLRGLEAGIRLGWFDWKKFDCRDYEHYQQVEHGDMNWIVPNRFLAHAGPLDRSDNRNQDCTPADLIPAFKAKNIQLVVRLNSKQYNQDAFIAKGIKHVDLIFQDGSCPPAAIINKFLYATERTKGAIAVHCKAGLGRTGTLIGLYVMKHYGITAREFIAWSRLSRPGSVIGPQQQFLCDMQQEMFRHGKVLLQPLASRALSTPVEKQLEQKDTTAAVRLQDMRIKAARTYTDEGQGDHLVRAKREGCIAREVALPCPRKFCGFELPATAKTHGCRAGLAAHILGKH